MITPGGGIFLFIEGDFCMASTSLE
ncbi:hypothetical protein AvCA_28930 [Azotobacter vinelandii CA]|uniref:Uncharacterized protein n=2 Tax=Azotobacter vinelandii TaxID=354 RepID=C1DLX5_AZOVD|nr:hypothetical protein Avin_28930 [Azotobacter vinelandii DJ]AGK14822.1 hypothetical protein AvCA_28930 [Azotobacter vinelandii CA]AGK20936.1 hypothetical protein AvCA6_28930 [Azotobacter vinelandii CA6]